MLRALSVRQTSLAAIVTIAAAAPLLAQGPIRATTEDGRKVILSPDGSWRFATPGAAPATSSARPASATERVELLKGRMALYFDPGKWRASKSAESGRLTFAHTSGDGYAMVISERLEMPLQALRTIAINNAKEAASDARLVSEEERTVNGLTVLCMHLEGTLSSVKFDYLGYYYTGPEGSVQVITYTGHNLFPEYKPEFETFLNGFTRSTP